MREMNESQCDIIIVVWNQLTATRKCVDAIERSTHYPYRLILVDNNSDEYTAEYLNGLARGRDSVTLIRNSENMGFIKAANQGLRLAASPYVCLMNNDTVATAGWLGKMVALAESDTGIGLVNPKSESPGSLSLEEYSCVLSRNKGEFLETNQCMGFCMLIKREVLERIGYLDEIYGIGGFDDTDYSKRANAAGYKCVCAKDAYVYHEWHTSFKKTGNREMLVRRNEKIFFDKWGKYLRVGYPISYKKDTFYIDINTSLALAREWNWVHAWLNMSAPLKSELRSLKLAEHQSLRLLNLPGNTTLFYFGVLSKLIGRRLKGKKVFDVILVSDKALFRFLSTFKRLFSIPLVYIDKNKFHYCKEGENDKDIWRERARGIAEFVKKGKAT